MRQERKVESNVEERINNIEKRDGKRVRRNSKERESEREKGGRQKKRE